MQRLAPGVHLIALQPKFAINAYILGDILIDAGIRQSAAQLKQALQHIRLRAHALTHAHPDHQGSSHALCTHFGLPLWTSQSDADAMERGDLTHTIPTNIVTRLQGKFWTGPGHAVQRVLREGDDLNGFEVLETPGHAPGHLAFWREKDRVLILGDVLVNLDFRSWQTRIKEPPRLFTVDHEMNRKSIQRLTALQPEVVAFGHGRPVLNADQFQRSVQALLS
ncbi:MBL fold metallo-hydrolase [Deinococcus hopiensis]|uniref:Glyoxylase, beta-lactamase superfamily II n=1 Tax=Deinococcus hopiensis KR-140 TaxID=695939 RepID=A0A1W1VVJ5_9DEIO|nr:MBL fold metallo-hydrolase [Deinococcus hopiensis]SMB96884.1 Glyoxylase, beta-lactamase superfamily II [Deinococcus hopiensis KR-140]